MAPWCLRSTALGRGRVGDRLWFCPPRFGRYLVVMLLTIAANSLWEWLTVTRLGLWGYSEWHLAEFGIGLVAVVQAVVVPPCVYLLLAWRVGKGPKGMFLDSAAGP
jgi:hypothetical protein